MLLVGITGGIGAGKSTVLSHIAGRGDATVDADDIVHDLYAENETLRDALARRWGTDVMREDGGVDRRAVAEIVFASESERAWLNGVVHPLVRQAILRLAAPEGGLLFCGVPLLYEAGWASDMVCVVAVWCDARTQHMRLCQRGWSAAQIRLRLSSQLPADEKLSRADFGIVNNGTMDLLHRQCDRLYRIIQDTYAR